MRSRRLHLLLIVSLLAYALSCAVAQASPVAYTLQTGPRAVKDALKLNGDQLVAFQYTASPAACSAGDPRNSSDSQWTITLPAVVTLSGGAFQFSGQAPSTYYDVGASRASYTAAYTVTGAVSADHRVVTGTVTITNANDPFLTGCSGTFPFMAIPTVAESTGPGNPRATFQGQFVSFSYRAGVISDLRLQANFQCGAGVDTAEVGSRDYNLPAIHTDRAGQWGVRADVLDEYGNIVALSITGRVAGRHASGRVKITEPSGLTGVAGQACGGDHAWSAQRPSPPAPPGPEAFFQWDAIRVPAGAAYRYYFYVSGMTCSNGATAAVLRVAGRSSTVTCRQGHGWASGPLAPGRSYAVSATAVETRGRRVIKRGVPVPEVLAMPGTGDEWQPIRRLPGNPPA